MKATHTTDAGTPMLAQICSLTTRISASKSLRHSGARKFGTSCCFSGIVNNRGGICTRQCISQLCPLHHNTHTHELLSRAHSPPVERARRVPTVLAHLKSDSFEHDSEPRTCEPLPANSSPTNPNNPSK